MRSAIYPAQANFKDVWMVCSLDVYREPFYWDGPATMHSFCNWDADLSSRMMQTFWCVSDKLEFKLVASPIEFHGLVADIPTRAQAERLLIRLKDPAKYAPSAKYPYGLPSAPFDSPLFVVKDSWSGTIWPIQTYYTVRGLANYGYQNEAAALSANLYGMMARDYGRTGSIWEQYDPITGKDLGAGFTGNGGAEIGRGYFTSGITTSVLDMLLRGLFGFERCDEENSFYFTPRSMGKEWHGVDNLRLHRMLRISLQMRDAGEGVEAKVQFAGLPAGLKSVSVTAIDSASNNGTIQAVLPIDSQGQVQVTLPRTNGVRYLWH
jgi:hypothetical protein